MTSVHGLARVKQILIGKVLPLETGSPLRKLLINISIAGLIIKDAGGSVAWANPLGVCQVP